MVKLTRICVPALILAMICASAPEAPAQTQRGWLMVGVPPSFMNASGLIGAATRLCTTVTGTSTSLATYSDPALSSALPNPVVLNSIGIPTSNGSTQSSVYGQPGFIYRVTLYANGTGNTCNGTAVGAQIWQRDNIYDSASLNAFANVRLCDRFAGANAGAKIAACMADLPATGGIADARAFQGAQTVSSLLTVPAKVKLLLGAGTFTVSTATLGIQMSAGSSIQCDSPAESILHFTSTAADGIGMHDDTTVDSCMIRGPSGSVWRNGYIGVEFAAKSNVRITNNIIEDWGSHCVNAGGGSAGVVFENNIVQDCHQDGILIPGGETNASIKDNHFYRIGSWAIDCAGCLRSIIQGNYVDDAGATWTPDGGGLSIFAYEHANTTVYDVKDNLFVDNTFRDVNGRGIGISANATLSGNTIARNIIVGDAAITNGVGIIVGVANTTSELVNNMFIGNTATGNTGGTDGTGILFQYFSGTCARNKISGNNLGNNDYGVVIPLGCTDTDIENNEMFSAATPILDSATTGETRDILNRKTTANNYATFTTPIQTDYITPLTASFVAVTSNGATQLSLTSTAAGTREYAMLLDTSGNFYTGYDVAAATPRITVSSAGVIAINSVLSAGSAVQIGVNPATTGALRLAQSDAVYFRNAANDANLLTLSVGSTNQTVLRGGGGATTLDLQRSSGASLVSWTDAGIGTTPNRMVFGSTVAVGVLTGATGTTLCYDAASANTIATCTSLRSVKDNIEGLTEAEGNSVLSLQPSSFTVKATGQSQMGFIAEEVYAVDPRMSSFYDGKLNGVNYDAVVAALVRQVQEQERRIRVLEGRQVQ